MTHLVVFSHKLFYRTSRGLQTTGAFTIQMDALAPYFERVTLCVPIIDSASFHGVSVTASNIDFHPLPHYAGKMGFLQTAPSMRREMLAVMEHADLALVILPGYVEVLASALCQRHRFPIFQWVVGDWSRSMLARRCNPLAHWWASIVLAPLLDWLMVRLTRDVLTFYNGRILYEQGKPYHFTRVSSSIQEGDLYIRNKVNATPPYRVLFVGRLSAEKGIAHLLKAIALLAAEGEAIELHVVRTGPLDAKLQRQAQTMNIAHLVHFHGFVPQGNKLRRLYRQSDVFVLPSLQDQQPKVLMEAMSQSVPVIATNVGGIPSVIKNGESGLLVPPAQPETLAVTIHHVLSKKELRQLLIEGGLAQARAHTVERETARMMRIISAHFGLRELAHEPDIPQQP